MSSGPPWGVTPAGWVGKTIEDILGGFEDSQHTNISPTLDVSANQPTGQFNGIVANAALECWDAMQASYNAFNPDAAGGATLTNVSAVTGTIRLDSTFSLAVCDVAISAGASVSFAPGDLVARVLGGDPAILFANLDPVIGAPGTFNLIRFQALTAGPYPVLSGLLSVIAAPAAQWFSVTNPTDGTEGAGVESDPALRVRRVQELGAAGNNTASAVKAAVRNVTNVQSVDYFENVTDVTNPVTGLPPHSFEIIMYDGTVPSAEDDEIAQAIFDNATAGIEAYSNPDDPGFSSGTATDSQGVEHTICFTRVEVVTIYVTQAIFVTTPPWSVPVGLTDDATVALIDALAAFTFAIGQDVVVKKLERVTIGQPGVEDIDSTKVGTVPTPTGTVNLTIGPRQIAAIDTSNVVITTALWVDS